MDNTSFLLVQRKLFHFMGIDLRSENTTHDRRLVTLAFLTPMLAFTLPSTFAVFIFLKDVEALSDITASLVAVILTMAKYFVFKYYRKDFVDLIYSIRDILEEELLVWPQASLIIEEANRSDQLLSLTYARSFYVALVFAVIKPCIIMILMRVRLGTTQLELPYRAVYPWNNQLLWYYVPTYLWNTVATVPTVTLSLCVDTLLFSLTYNVSAIFRIAEQRVSLLTANKLKPRQELQELVQILRLHQQGLFIAQRISLRYRPLVLVQFFCSTLLLCFVGFQVADVFPNPQSLYFITFAGSILIALFIYSHCGEILKKASLDFAMAVYKSNWVEFAPATKRALLVAMMRAQRPCQLDGYVFEANMATFLAIVRSAISYIMMLRSFNV